MLSNVVIVGGLSIALALFGFVLTAYGIAASKTPNGLSIAIIGLPIMGLGLAVLAISLLTMPESQ
jgi:hypothetical protein